MFSYAVLEVLIILCDPIEVVVSYIKFGDNPSVMQSNTTATMTSAVNLQDNWIESISENVDINWMLNYNLWLSSCVKTHHIVKVYLIKWPLNEHLYEYVLKLSVGLNPS